MKKLYKLKSWFSLPDAANRLTASLGEDVSVADILQLIIEQQLPLSWYARHVSARLVAPFTSLWGKGFGKPLDPDLPDDQLIAMQGWHSVNGEEAIVRLNGLYLLELDYCGALKDHIHEYLTNTSAELVSLDGFFVSDSQMNVWQVMDYEPSRTYKTPDGKEEKLEGYHYPSGSYPELSELVIQRHHIEAFESSLLAPDAEAPAPMTLRSETTYLNIIGAMLHLMLGKSPGGQEHSIFTNQAAIIEALLGYNEAKQGISTRTLEEKFAAAKRQLES